MTVQTASVEIVEVDASPSGRQAKELVEALADFAKSRSTRELIAAAVNARSDARFACPCSRTATRFGRQNWGACCAR